MAYDREMTEEILNLSKEVKEKETSVTSNIDIVKSCFSYLNHSSLFIFHESLWIRQFILTTVCLSENIILIKERKGIEESESEEEHECEYEDNILNFTETKILR